MGRTARRPSAVADRGRGREDRNPRRPDSLRRGDPALFARLNQGKASVALDIAAQTGREALLALIARADIVIEAARPRALAQLGIEADALVAAQPGLVWLTITGHGARAPQRDWVGFGDDTAVAGGLSAPLLLAASGEDRLWGRRAGGPVDGDCRGAGGLAGVV